ncbi:class I SAM-dependent methyltransferase [Acetobacter thailandicus]|uniref:class I SAM-dependent methyltransferase n=1 Tax=Acetobacter thailandicus TaxID=1502842 RepID=UPI001BAA0E0A|nr:class I SAM-dependent methyltransferase [Acetobacter thailandicus]MBS0980984.1 class I SAM-dependent methyltransferase [Acetobacter thailandicus]
MASFEKHKNSCQSEKYAEKFSVVSHIHPKDYIFEYKIDKNPSPDLLQRDENETRSYFEDGAYSCRKLIGLLEEYNLFPADKPLELLEFASGYGCVSRHLATNKNIHLTSCDIHPAAVEFIQNELGVDSVLSAAQPENLKINKKFDVIFALSFFSHMPDATFGKWLMTLYSLLRPGGHLIFTTHGVDAYRAVNMPPPVGDNWSVSTTGCWFYAGSEQKDLPGAEYGISLVPFEYATRLLNDLNCGQLIRFERGAWWQGGQDLFIVRSEDVAFHTPTQAQLMQPMQSEINHLRSDISIIKHSTSWHITRPLRAFRKKLKKIKT